MLKNVRIMEDDKRESKEDKLALTRSVLKSIQTSQFYAKSQPVTTKKEIAMTQWLSQLKEDRREAVERLKLAGIPSGVWKVFPKQKMAFEYIDSQYENLHAFAFEDEDSGHGGKRKYLVTSYYEFWLKYSEMLADKRCYYEVIRENTPCRLYFDLEFKYQHNPIVDGEKMLLLFKKFLIHEIYITFHIVCSEKDMVDLCSTTFEKFSHHLIVNIPNVVFQNSLHVGNFVNKIIEDIYAGQVSHAVFEKENFDTFFMNNEKMERTLFIDPSVYSRNRNFRLFKSTKFGKNVPLVIAATNQFPIKTEESLFYQSLVCAIQYHPETIVLQYKNEDDDATSKKILAGHAQVLSRKERINPPFQEDQKSPFPKIDDFVIKVVQSNDGHHAYIRTCFYYPEGKTIVYHIGGSRYCHNIKRQHRSNHIMMIVDLLIGVTFQKCLDPDCRKIGYKSLDVPLPLELNPFSTIDNAVFGAIQDDELL